jgi:hypothetical protein
MQAKEIIKKYNNPKNFFNRDLSWVEFNRRVLEEALNPHLPLLEKVKFLSIFSSNLDEFYMIRVSGLKEQVAAKVIEPTIDGLTPIPHGRVPTGIVSMTVFVAPLITETVLSLIFVTYIWLIWGNGQLISTISVSETVVPFTVVTAVTVAVPTVPGTAVKVAENVPFVMGTGFGLTVTEPVPDVISAPKSTLPEETGCLQ